MSTSPSRAVLDAFAAGETSLNGIAVRTGLPADLVAVVVDELVRMGMVRREVLGSGCPSSGGCGGCVSASASGASCGVPGRGPVLLSLPVNG